MAEEKAWVEDKPEHRRMRFYLLRLHDPRLRAFLEQAKTRNSAEALAELVQKTDLAEVNDGDLAELFFALGPTTLSMLIEKMLRDAKTDVDVEGVASLTEIRHSLLSSMNTAS